MLSTFLNHFLYAEQASLLSSCGYYVIAHEQVFISLVRIILTLVSICRLGVLEAIYDEHGVTLV